MGGRLGRLGRLSLGLPLLFVFWGLHFFKKIALLFLLGLGLQPTLPEAQIRP